jgi:hypothetical protein
MEIYEEILRWTKIKFYKHKGKNEWHCEIPFCLGAFKLVKTNKQIIL